MNPRRSIHTDTIKNALTDLLYQASFNLPDEVCELFRSLRARETGELSRHALDVLCQNAEIARSQRIPLCQDCGVVVVFMEIGQDVSIEGEHLHKAINDAVAQSYDRFYLRKSIVGDPLERKNTGTNAPSFIHTEIVPGSSIRLQVYLKGGGSENMSALRMFRPTAPVEEIIDYIEEQVRAAGPNPCPPLFLGVGIGGTADAAMLNAKKAVLRGVGSTHENPYYAGLERTILERLNATGVGALGFGGLSTAAAVYIREAPTHIATLPVALNLSCHSLRFREAIL